MALCLPDIAQASSVPAPDRVFAYDLHFMDSSSSSYSFQPSSMRFKCRDSVSQYSRTCKGSSRSNSADSPLTLHVCENGADMPLLNGIVVRSLHEHQGAAGQLVHHTGNAL